MLIVQTKVILATESVLLKRIRGTREIQQAIFLPRNTEQKRNPCMKTHSSVEFQHEASFDILLCRLASTPITS